MSINFEKPPELEFLNVLREREQKAKVRFELDATDRLSFAIVGSKPTFETWIYPEVATFRKVSDPPNEFELARILVRKEQMSAVARYSPLIDLELTLLGDFSEPKSQSSFTLGWWIISALRVKTGAEFLVPAAANYSWSAAAGLPESVFEVSFIEDVPQASRLGNVVVLNENDLMWSCDNLEIFAQLLEDRRFRLAVDALTTHQHLLRPRMMAAALWAGIEALLSVDAELRLRLSMFAAVLIEERGESRFTRYKSVSKLYIKRNACVHGGDLVDSEIKEHVIEARDLLTSMVLACVNRRSVPDREELERGLLC